MTVAVEPEMATAWDNVDIGTYENPEFENDPKEDIAKAICIECPVREKCLRDAITDNEAEGIRGGYRFSFGNVSREEGKIIFNEWGLRARVAKQTRAYVPEGQEYVESDEMQGVREDV